MSEKKLKNAIRRCPYWPSTLFNHTCVCVCVLSRNHPSSCITDPRWICCSWTGRLFWPRTAQRTIYAETINVTHTKHTPVPRVNPDTSQQTTNTNSINATLVIPPSQTAAGVPSTHHPLCPRYVKEKKKTTGKKEREKAYIYTFVQKRDTDPRRYRCSVYTPTTNKGVKFLYRRPWLTPQTCEEPPLSVCTPEWGSRHTAHCGETPSLPTHSFRSQQSREHRKYNYMTKDIVPNTF